jgi:hypothetical protein
MTSQLRAPSAASEPVFFLALAERVHPRRIELDEPAASSKK